MHIPRTRTAMRISPQAGIARRLAARRGESNRLAHQADRGTATNSGTSRNADQVAGPRRRAEWREVQAILDEEIQRLPELLRSVFVLCILEGRRGSVVARELKLKEGTVWSRLAAARSRLQKRLTRRGLSLPMVLASAVVSGGSASALIPNSLVTATVETACVVSGRSVCASRGACARSG